MAPLRLRFAFLLISVALGAVALNLVNTASANTAKLSATEKNIRSELKRMLDARAIRKATYELRLSQYKRARDAVPKLKGVRKKELAAVVRNLKAIAKEGSLTVGRLDPLWLTLNRNYQWWRKGRLLKAKERVSFPNSRLVWQYYPGQGLGLQVLASFGEINRLWKEGHNKALAKATKEMLELPVSKNGGLAWEYYFRFRKGPRIWTSGMAQATGLQALSRAGLRLKSKGKVFPVVHQGLRLFELAAPKGVKVGAGSNLNYALYSYSPNLHVANAALQALIGLHDYADNSGSKIARRLFRQGDRAARKYLPLFDTGEWSLYSRGPIQTESDASYHQLVTEFARGMYKRTGAKVYDRIYRRFKRYAKTRKANPFLSNFSNRATNVFVDESPNGAAGEEAQPGF